MITLSQTTNIPSDLSERTKRAVAILQAAVDRDKAQKRLRYSRGLVEKPSSHDELHEAMDRNWARLQELNGKDKL